MIFRHSEQNRGCNAADEVRREATLSIAQLQQRLISRDPSTPLRFAQDDWRE
jgi:hypothetical protein